MGNDTIGDYFKALAQKGLRYDLTLTPAGAQEQEDGTISYGMTCKLEVMDVGDDSKLRTFRKVSISTTGDSVDSATTNAINKVISLNPLDGLSNANLS